MPRLLAPFWARVVLGAGAGTLGGVLLGTPSSRPALFAIAVAAMGLGAAVELGRSPFRPSRALSIAAATYLPIAAFLVPGSLLGGSPPPSSSRAASSRPRRRQEPKQAKLR